MGAGPFIAGLAEWGYLKPLLVCRIAQKVKVRSNVWMESSGGKSVVTDSLDGFFTGDQFFESLLQQVKQECLDGKGEVEYTSEEEFKCSVTLDFPELAEQLKIPEAKWPLQRRVQLDTAGTWITWSDYSHGELLWTRFWRIHSDPVRAEMWTVHPNGTRSAGGKDAVGVRFMLMKFLIKSIHLQSFGVRLLQFCLRSTFQIARGYFRSAEWQHED